MVILNSSMIGWDNSPSISKERYKLAYIQVRCTLTDFGTYMRVDFIPPDAIINSVYVPITLSFIDVAGQAFDFPHNKWEYDFPGEIEKFAILFASQVASDTHPIIFKDHGIAGGAPYLGTKSFKVDSSYSEYTKLVSCLADPTYSAGNFEGLLKTYILDTLNVSVSNFPSPVTSVSVNNFPAPVTDVAVNNFPSVQSVNLQQVKGSVVYVPSGDEGKLPVKNYDPVNVVGNISVVNQPDINITKVGGYNVIDGKINTNVVNFPVVQDVNIEKVNGIDVPNNLPVDVKASIDNRVNLVMVNGAAVGIVGVPVDLYRVGGYNVTGRNLPVNIEAVNAVDVGNNLPVSIDGASSVDVANFPSVQNVKEQEPLTDIAVNNFPSVQNVLEQNPLTDIAVNNFPDPMNVNIQSDSSGYEDTIQEYQNK